MRQARWVLGLVLLSSCSDSGPRVDIVVPKGFIGPVWIVLDLSGQDIPLVNGRYQVVIPAGGALRVRSYRPFERWHPSSAQYDDGTLLREEYGANPAGPDVVALRGGGHPRRQGDPLDAVLRGNSQAVQRAAGDGLSSRGGTVTGRTKRCT